MTFSHYAGAWQFPGTHVQKLVLLALADHADKYGRCFPSITRVSYMTGLHRTTVMHALEQLESRGVLTRSRQLGKSTRYTLQPVAQPAQSPSATSGAELPNQSPTPTTPVVESDLTGSGERHEPTNEPSNEPTKDLTAHRITIEDVDR